MLRPYQIESIRQIESVKGNCMLQLPTGAGKTFTFCELAKRHFAEKVEKVLIVVHRQELLEQAYLSLGERALKVERGLKKIPHDYDYYIAMVETLNRRLNYLPKFGMVIIDEAHIGNFKKLPFFDLQNTKVVGVSATPTAKTPLKKLFHEIIMPTTIRELIDNKFLLNCKVYGFASDLVGKQKFKIRGGDFDEKQMADFYSSEKMVKNVVNAYWELLRGKKTIIFNVNLQHNFAVYMKLKEEGLNVFSITGETPIQERKEILKKFKETNDGIMCNVGVLTTGFDEPTVHGIMLNRATKSLSLYMQMIGRGSRPCENKQFFTVVDLGKNVQRHGFFDDFIDWQKFFNQGEKEGEKKEGAMPIKECKICGYLQHTRKVICDNCGHNFEDERLRQEKEEKDKKFILLTKENPIEIPTDKIYEMALEREWKPYAVLHKIAEHIINYEKKHSPIVEKSYSNLIGITELEKWCDKYGVKFNKWHKDFIVEIIDKKRNV